MLLQIKTLLSFINNFINPILGALPKMAKEGEKKTCGQVLDEWKEFLWNPRTHQFLGRTASSWGE